MKKILTLVLSGYGISDKEEGNALKSAQMNTLNGLLEKYPNCFLNTSKLDEDSNECLTANSEISHMLIGSGKNLKSNFELVNSFFESLDNDSLKELLKENNKRIHLVGLLSDGNIHSSIDHFKAMYKILADNGFKKIYFHIITDGVDSPQDSSISYIKSLEDEINSNNIGTIATICGRYYAMDRDMNYDRTEEYYNLLVKGNGLSILNYESTINALYEKGLTDEYIKPLILDETGIIKNGDKVIWLNFRAERSKQILQCFLDTKFNKFKVKEFSDLDIYTFLPVDKNLKVKNFIEQEKIENPLGIYLSKLNVKQARIAELDKYQHVTTCFDGGYSGKIEECDKYQIPSYDADNVINHPEMNAPGVLKKIIDCMEKDFNFILANFANIDVLAHTGSFNSTVMASKVVDKCLEKIMQAAEDNFYTVIITSDVGNAEEMLDSDGNVNPMHTMNKVPFIFCDEKVELNQEGDLSNIAPTILDYMDISIPLQMTSDSLIIK